MPSTLSLGWRTRRDRKRFQHFDRTHQRATCQIPSTVTITTSHITIPGQLLDISRAGCLFRPRLHYLLQRNGVRVIVNVGGLELPGVIVNTIPRGYGILLEKEIDVAAFQTLLAQA